MSRPKRLSETEAASRARLALAAARMRRDPLLSYEPNPMQRRYMESPVPYRVVWGDNRGGKSYGVAAEIGLLMADRHPVRPLRQGAYLLMVLSRAQASMVWKPYLLGEGAEPGMRESTGFLQNIKRAPNGRLAIKWDRNANGDFPRLIEMEDGSSLSVGLNIKGGWKRVQGPKFRGVWLDESGEDTEAMINELLVRLAEYRSEDPLSGFLSWCGTETTINEKFDEFRDRCADGRFKDYEEFRALMSENPAISEEVREGLARDLGEAEARVRIGGGASRTDSVRILPEFNDQQHVLAEPYLMGERDVLVASYDPGISDNTQILVGAVSKQSPGRLVILQAIYHRGGNVFEEAAKLRQWLSGRRLLWMAYDKSGATKDRGSGHSALAQMRQALNNPRYWLTGEPWFRKPKGQINTGLREVKKYLCPAPEVYWEPMLVFDKPTIENGLVQAIREVKRYRLKSQDHIGKRFTHDIIHRKDNETPDNLRYLCSCHPRWEDHGPNLITEPVHLPAAEAASQLIMPAHTPQQEAMLQAQARSAALWERRKAKIRQRRRQARMRSL